MIKTKILADQSPITCFIGVRKQKTMEEIISNLSNRADLLHSLCKEFHPSLKLTNNNKGEDQDDLIEAKWKRKALYYLLKTIFINNFFVRVKVCAQSKSVFYVRYEQHVNIHRISASTN